MSGSKYGGTDAGFHPPMQAQERHHAKLAFDRAEDGDDAAKLAWFREYGRRLVDNAWSNSR